MATLKPNEVRIEHPKGDRPLVVLRRAFETGRYPGWVEVGAAEAPDPIRWDPAGDDVEPDDTAETATDNTEES